MKPRVTISLNAKHELKIRLNESGRDELIRELAGLRADHEHFHLSSVGPTELLLSATAYMPEDETIHTAKIMPRLDEWDRKYFPHVITEDNS